MTTLATERLLLRPFRALDVADVAAYATRETFWRYLPLAPQTPAMSAEFVAQRIAGGLPDSAGNWSFAAEMREGGHMIGAFRIGIRHPQHRAGDIGYGLHHDWWGRGLATEGVRALLAFGFGTLELHRVIATADARNERSWKVMERVGMRREGILRGDKLVRGEWRDSVLYAILAEEFDALL